MRAFALAIVLAALGMPSAPAVAQEFNLAIRNHKFEPQEIRVPAGKRVSIYITNEDGLTVVVKAGAAFEVLAQNDFDDYTLSSPAISEGQIFIRTSKFLYCIGKRASG